MAGNKIPMITHHTQLLQALIDKHGLQSYLEIGVQEPKNNFFKIHVKHRYGIDPTVEGLNFYTGISDEYFARPGNMYYDLVFIDGDHTAEQVKRDFDNSLKCLSEGGFIVIHDCLPVEEKTTTVPRATRIWHGSVYKFCMTLLDYTNITFTTYNIDEGCCVIQKNGAKQEIAPEYKDYFTWNDYKELSRELMNVVDEVVL